MGEGYFYTLSAVAQSFAAIVALIAVFVIYELQLLKNERGELINELRRICVAKRRAKQSPYSNRNHSTEQVTMMTNAEVLSEARGFTGGLTYLLDKNKETLKLYDFNGQFSKNITKWFKRTLLFNSITVLLSLLLLPWKNVFPNFLQNIILGIVLLLSVFALSVTIHAILFTLESEGISVIRRIFVKKAKR